ncbi:MAG: hypothetical protein AB8H86_16880 [Polyangiales bacterium]
MSTRIVGLVIFVLSFLPGCADDAALPECRPGECECSASECACVTDCMAQCTSEGTCPLRCSADARCEINQGGEGIAALTCEDDSDCKAHNVLDGATLECQGSADCDFKADGPAVAVCSGNSECKVEVGEGGSMTCADSANCDFKCVGTSCDIQCAETATCEVKCGSADTDATVCDDGRITCGSC